MAKFGAIRTAVVRDSSSQASTWPRRSSVKPGGADDGMDSVVDQELQVVHHDVGVREVDDDLGVAVGEHAQRIPRVDPGREREVVCGLDGLNHGGADLALGAKHSDSHGAYPSFRRLWITFCGCRWFELVFDA